MKPLYSRLITLVLIATLSQGTAPKVEGAEVKLEDLKRQLDAIQSQLNHLPPTWDQTLPASSRFRGAMPGILDPCPGEVCTVIPLAVLDLETGLVWERFPDTTSQTWNSAQTFCNIRIVGNRKGWRLPTVQELASLVDPTQSNPALPAGHPFSNVQSSHYWSATTSAVVPANAWGVDLFNGGVGISDKTLNTFFVWCVRGGHGGPDAQ